ncbi:MAG: UDP-N-acetylmuramoyl-L-alanyl-D-glutamate--2,6-diaminopimelate ligase [Pirellulales bacterium]|nr:UDP-N-acetylmuramoyl-L-alanyl-D-glutamate--2,6-diaminopimelate ligase [Pirellulales bacterium]
MMPETISCNRGLNLRQLLPEASIFGADEIYVESCSADSRHCRAGDLFVAQIGSHVDGHDYVGEAIDRGATAILAERYVPTKGVLICTVSDTRIAFGKLSQALAGYPSRKLKAIGVTGTNGKTTTCWLIASVLEAAGYRTGLTGTIANCDGATVEPSAMTTPSAPQLAEWLSRMVANDCSHAVMEISSHALAQARTAGIEFDAACVTNVRRDHLDFHNTLKNYRDAKAKLLSQVNDSGFVVVNADDAVASSFLSLSTRPSFTIGLENEAQLTATLLERQFSEQTFLLHAGSDCVPVRTRIVGDQHIYNCLTAAAVGLLYGIALPDIVRGLEQLEAVPGRMQRIECGQPFGVFVDYAHTPDALHAVLGSLRALTPGRLICVFGAGGERDREKRPFMAKAVQAHADVAVVTDDNPRREDPAKIRRDILRGFTSLDAIVVKRDRADSIAWALDQAVAGDCVLIAGKGHEEYQTIGSTKHWLDDREIARQWLYQHAPSVVRLLDPWKQAKAG